MLPMKQYDWLGMVGLHTAGEEHGAQAASN
jgi:hypothetical protein